MLPMQPQQIQGTETMEKLDDGKYYVVNKVEVTKEMLQIKLLQLQSQQKKTAETIATLEQKITEMV